VRFPPETDVPFWCALRSLFPWIESPLSLRFLWSILPSLPDLGADSILTPDVFSNLSNLFLLCFFSKLSLFRSALSDFLDEHRGEPPYSRIFCFRVHFSSCFLVLLSNPCVRWRSLLSCLELSYPLVAPPTFSRNWLFS